MNHAAQSTPVTGHAAPSATRPAISVGIVGASGYAGGELARILMDHPGIAQLQVASAHHAGTYLHALHPHLRPAFGHDPIRIVSLDDLAPCDVLFLAQRHGMSMGEIDRFARYAPRIIDLSADFRLHDPQDYPRWYGHAHADATRLATAVYGIPELHRSELPDATLISGAGCLATAAILGLRPLVATGLLDQQLPLVIEGKVGSSALGATPAPGSHHPERSHVVRAYAPTGHRHTAEIAQELRWPIASGSVSGGIAFSATAVELVRGVAITAHAFIREKLTERDLWQIYRQAYRDEPFIRLVKERAGVYRYPEPKVLAGTNFCDIGFEVDPHAQRIVIIAALDNLMKGAASNAIQALNCAMGWDETTGLRFTGLHPI